MSRASAGLPFSHVRPLEPHEREWLIERARRARQRRIAFGCGTALVPVLICFPLALLLVTNAAALLMIPAIWACLWLPLKWVDARKRSAVALASAGAESAEVFEGVANAGAFAEVSLPELLDRGLILDGETPQRLDRVSASGESIRVNELRLDPPVWVDETDVAPPESPTPDFPALVPEFAMADPSLGRRPLSPAETEELRRLVPARESLRQHGCFLGFCVYVLAGTFQRVEGDPGATFFFVLLRFVLLGYLTWRFYLAGRERVRQRRDLAEASVVRVEEDGALLEFLPNLRLIWTVDGHPSPWRHAAQSKPRPPR